jgi:hypothetical protein
MKRLLTILLILLLPTPAYADGPQIGTAIRGHIDRDTCRFVRYDGEIGYTHKEMAKTIRCAARRWPVPGGPDKAIDVASCESGLNPKAVSASGTYQGVFQQSVTYWPGRFQAYRVRRFELKHPVLNGRSNVVVSGRMAHRSGWYPWTCA